MSPEIGKFIFWCQKVLPLVYDDSLSYYEVLCKVADKLNQCINNINANSQQIAQNKQDIQSLQNALDKVNQELEKIKNGEYVDLYLDSIINWIDNNLLCLFERAVRFVSFGLTADGYFCAYIPSNWDCLEFDTIIDTNDPLYGHLIMKY